MLPLLFTLDHNNPSFGGRKRFIESFLKKFFAPRQFENKMKSLQGVWEKCHQHALYSGKYLN